MVTKELVIRELDDPTICINLCFASDGFMEYLSSNRSVLETIVRFNYLSSSLLLTLFNLLTIQQTRALISTVEGNMLIKNG